MLCKFFYRFYDNKYYKICLFKNNFVEFEYFHYFCRVYIYDRLVGFALQNT